MNEIYTALSQLTFWEYPVWHYIYFSNTVGDYASALVYFILFLVIFKIFQAFILRYFSSLSKKTKTDIDDKIVEIIKSIHPGFYFFLSFYLSLNVLFIEPFWEKIINVLLVVWVVWQIISSLHFIIDYVIKKYAEKRKGGAQNAVFLFGKIIKTSLWFIGTLLVLSNLGVNINSLIAGLGIGGIAVALALQNILSDLFSSFAIFFDKPFEVGDFIVVGPHMGTVEKIGIKTTRLRALQGEEIVISNQELTGARIQNFKKLKERRVVFSFGVIYNTPQKKMGRIPYLVENIITEVPMARFDRAHFKSFGPSSLDYEVVYYIKSGDYNDYMDIQQKINLEMKGLFEKEKIEFAYPTQTIYLEKD